MRKILYMVRKEFLQVFRTREMLGIIFIAPLIQTLVLGFAITTEVKQVKLVIADQDNSFLSREIVRAFSHTDRFRVVGHETDVAAIDAAIHAWQAQMALVIPPNFSRDLQRRMQPQVQILVDGIDGNTAGAALAYANGILLEFARDYLLRPANFDIVRAIHLVEMQDRMWYNLNLNNAQYMVPGIIAVLLTVISMMLSAMSLVREKEIGTLEQLMVTPLKKSQLLLGKIIPFLVLAFVELAIVLTVAQFIFSIRMAGSYLLLGALAFLFLFTTLGLGIFISTITHSQQQAMFVAWFFMVVMIIMSGFFIPIDNMPEPLRLLTYLNPMRYFMYIIREIFQKAATLRYLLPDVLPMTAYGLIIFMMSVLKFQKRVT